MPKPRATGAPDPEITFEQALAELEGINDVLEDGRLPLDELVDKYERGARLVALCRQRLDAAQQRIELITRRNGEPPSLESLTETGNVPATPLPAAPKTAPPRKTSSSDLTNSDEIRLF